MASASKGWREGGREEGEGGREEEEEGEGSRYHLRRCCRRWRRCSRRGWIRLEGGREGGREGVSFGHFADTNESEKMD